MSRPSQFSDHRPVMAIYNFPIEMEDASQKQITQSKIIKEILL